jgi:hypothetical protein
MSVEILASPSNHMIKKEQKCFQIFKLRITSKNGNQQNLLPEYLVNCTLLVSLQCNCGFIYKRLRPQRKIERVQKLKLIGIGDGN